MFKRIISLLLALLMAGGICLSGVAEEFTPKPAYRFLDSSTPVNERLDEILSLMTLGEKIAMSTGGTAIARLGLNSARGGSGEALHGITAASSSTVFPTPLGMSQSWDTELMYDYGAVVAEESLADNGGPGRLAPVLDVLHDPRAGRAYETMGEDSFLVGKLGEAITGGMNQRTEDGYFQFIPILKHPMPYNTEINRLWTNIVMSPRNYREYYMRTFKYSISAGNAKSLMNTYQMVNGVPFSVNPIQTELLNEWTPDYEGTGHYEYTTVNDYGSGSSMFVHSQRYFPDSVLGRAFGVAQGAQNGQLSWSFRSYGSWTAATDLLYDAYARGFITEEDLEENARRTLANGIRLGDFDQLELKSPYIVPGSTTSKNRVDVVKENRETAFRMSQEQIVLLKNDGILPLSGEAVKEAALLGPMADILLNDHYTGARTYAITLLDALQNKLGREHVAFDRAVDTIAIKASNGKYLEAANNPTWCATSKSNEDDIPIKAVGNLSRVTMDDVPYLFERYDYGSTYNLLRTPINGQYVQITPFAVSKGSSSMAGNAYSVTMINDTSAPGEANRVSGATNYVNHTTFRIVPTDDGYYGLYNLIAGNGSNGGVGKAYDADDEDLNNGSYVILASDNTLVADLSTIGPYRNEIHQDGASVLDSKVDIDGADEVIDNLADESKFQIDVVRSSEQAVDETLAQVAQDAPVILVLGYEPHLNAREAIDLYHPGLSDQQMRIIRHVTDDLGRDCILVIKTGSPMTITEDVQNNPRVKAILEIGHSGQEEGSALVSVLFDDGYSVPAVGFAPATPEYNTGDTPVPFEAYPGYLADEAAGTIPAASPAGRLSATWYKKISDIIGCSEDHAPASYAWPAYDEETNDNLSNLNGTINNGIMIYDIIKGERTYQYFNGEPLYPFGFGLSYGSFAYSGVTLSPVKDGCFTVTGSVANTGAYASDEVVEVYSAFISPESRIDQANQRLIAFARLHDIQPGETRPFSFTVDMKDTMGVYDVEAEKLIVEMGDYLIRAVSSSGDAAADGNSAILTVTAENGGEAAASRDLTQKKLAAHYDDYSTVGKQLDDIETVSSSVAYASDTAVQFRKNGAWIVFKDAVFSEAQQVFTARLGADRSAVFSVYALPAGSDPALLEGASPVAAFSLSDTRPIQGLPTGLGIGPVGVNPGTPEGQAYADAYVKPEFTVLCQEVNLAAGHWDVYLKTDTRGVRLDWFKFGQAADHAEAIAVSQLYKLDSIRVQGGELALTADLTPVTAVDSVSWAVTGADGQPTDLASISDKGVLTAAAKANGTVIVTATANGLTASKEILITNQLDENKAIIDGAPKTVEYLQLTTNGANGATDSIVRYQGTNQQVAVFSEQFSENAAQYVAPGTYLRIPADQIRWAVTGLDGAATDLATLDETGLLTATGKGDGKVLVTATLIANPDLVAQRVILLQNQTPKDAFTMIQAECYDVAEGYAAPAASTTFGKGGNEMGMCVQLAPSANAVSNTLLYKLVDFGDGATELHLRMASNGPAVAIRVLVDGREVAVLTDVGTADSFTYDDVAATFDSIQGVHDLALEFSGAAARVNWLQFN